MLIALPACNRSALVKSGVVGCITGNCQDGRGRYTWANGDKYVGEWKDGNPHGKGTYTWVAGNKYEGEWKEGNPHGEGTYTWATSNKYEGEWKDGQRVEQKDKIDPGSSVERSAGRENTLIKKAVTKPSPKPTYKKISGRKWAVIIGITGYEDRRIPARRQATIDAHSFYNWLVSPNKGGYDPARIKLLLGGKATKTNIDDALFNWLKQTHKEDMVTIYFVGHGSPASLDSPENLFFFTYDTNYGKISATGFPVRDIEKALKSSINAKKVVLFVDAFYSGRMGKAVDEAGKTSPAIALSPVNLAFKDFSRFGDEGVYVISASNGKQSLITGKNWGGGHSAFNYFLVDGLSLGADQNHDGYVTFGELIPFLIEKVRKETQNKQTPTVAGKFDMDLGLGE